MPVNPTINEDNRLDDDLVNNEPALNPTAAPSRVSGVNADREVDAPDDAPEGSVHVETDFYSAFDGTKGRAGGVYLDLVERHDAELLRAQQEGREPDLVNPPASTGTPLVVQGMRINNDFANPSSAVIAPVKEVAPISTAAVDVGIATTTTDTKVLEQELSEAQARNEAVESSGAPDNVTQGNSTPPDEQGATTDVSGTGTTSATGTETTGSGTKTSY